MRHYFGSCFVAVVCLIIYTISTDLNCLLFALHVSILLSILCLPRAYVYINILSFSSHTHPSLAIWTFLSITHMPWNEYTASTARFVSRNYYTWEMVPQPSTMRWELIRSSFWKKLGGTSLLSSLEWPILRRALKKRSTQGDSINATSQKQHILNKCRVYQWIGNSESAKTAIVYTDVQISF